MDLFIRYIEQELPLYVKRVYSLLYKVFVFYCIFYVAMFSISFFRSPVDIRYYSTIMICSSFITSLMLMFFDCYFFSNNKAKDVNNINAVIFPISETQKTIFHFTFDLFFCNVFYFLSMFGFREILIFYEHPHSYQLIKTSIPFIVSLANLFSIFIPAFLKSKKRIYLVILSTMFVLFVGYFAVIMMFALKDFSKSTMKFFRLFNYFILCASFFIYNRFYYDNI